MPKKAATTPPLRLEYRATDSLKPYERNSRKHSDAQIKLIAASITAHGWTKPIIVRGDTIAAGHGAWEAAKLLGMADVPVIDRADMTDAQFRQYVVADNRIGELSEWDWDVLGVELDELRDLGADLDAIGITPEDLSRLSGSPDDPPDGGTGGGSEPPDPDDLQVIGHCQDYQQQLAAMNALRALGIKVSVK
jgi:hypothetical protein